MLPHALGRCFRRFRTPERYQHHSGVGRYTYRAVKNISTDIELFAGTPLLRPEMPTLSAYSTNLLSSFQWVDAVFQHGMIALNGF